MKTEFSYARCALTFADIADGDIFMDKGTVFMKIKPIDMYDDDGQQIYDDNGNPVEINAIAVEDGKSISVSKYHSVKRLNAKLVIE